MNSRSITAALLAAAALCAAIPAEAAPRSVRNDQGVQWRVNEDDDSDDDGYALEKLRADRKADTAYGKGGKVRFDFGPSDYGALSLRVDAQERAWVLGTAVTGTSSTPTLLRFLPSGEPDTIWGARGRNSAGPPGQRAVGHDVMPLSDGSAWIAGTLNGSRGEQRAALWRMTSRGAFDMSFSPGGLWQRPGNEMAQAIALAEGAAGELAIGVLVHGPRQTLETWTLAAGARTPVLAAKQTSDDDTNDEMTLRRSGSGWAWQPGGGTVSVVGTDTVASPDAPPADATLPGTPASAAASDSGHGGYNPFVTADPVAAPEPSRDPTMPWDLLAGALTLGVLGYVIWRLRSGRS